MVADKTGIVMKPIQERWMFMILRLVNYAHESSMHEIGDLDSIAVIRIEVLTGDELAHVIYKDYSERVFDSDTHGRMQDFYDGEYEIYRFDSKRNLIDDARFLERKTSYDFEDWVYDDEEGS